MFNKNNPQNYQAKGNVAALGRVNANDSTIMVTLTVFQNCKCKTRFRINY